MQFFSLISLLLTIALGVWWFSSSLERQNGGVDSGAETTRYEEALDSARSAAELIEGSVPSGKSIEIYDGISVNENTESLDLSGRGLSDSLKAEVRHLTKLKTLNLSNNNFTDLPAEVGQLQQLETLNLSNNPFTGLPHELGNLNSLQILDVTGTQAATFDLDIIKAKLPAGTVIRQD